MMMMKVVAQQRRGRASNPRLLDRKSDALPLSHRATNKLSCRRETARCFVSLNISLHTRSIKVIPNKTIE